MARSAASRRYAKALFGIAQETGDADRIQGELATLAGLLAENAELRNVLLQPLHPVAQRRGVLLGVVDKMQGSPVLRSFYSFLIDQRRLVDFDAIREEYDRLAREQAGVLHAELETAAPLSDEQKARIQQALTRRVGQPVELAVTLNPDLVGGVVAKVGDLVLDGSLKSQLHQLRSSLLKS